MYPYSALCCVACRADGLQPGADALECAGCGRVYPIVADVPVMFSDVVRTRRPMLDAAVVATILQAMDLTPGPGNALRVRRASGAGARYGDRVVAAESRQFLRRVHASGYPIPAALLQPGDEPIAEAAGDGEPRCRWLLEYIPRVMACSQSGLANIRFENAGTAPMRHSGEGRVTIAFEWSNAAGDRVVVEDFRTPVPIDLPPGQAITLPVRLVAPAEPGRYTLVLRAVMEGVRWLLPDHSPLQIAVQPGAGFAPPSHWDVNANPPADYLADQARGLALLRSWLPDLPGPAAPRLLEIGGNAKPVLAHVQGEAYNIDVDLLGLQVGCIVRRARGNAVNIVCADAHNLPFAEAYFDAIIMFATLHHVPDPAALLRTLRAHLRPGGFIGIFCEPIGQVWPGAVGEAFLEELRHGVNEQGFSLTEYAAMFAAAGLHARALVADHNSLKAMLVPSCSLA